LPRSPTKSLVIARGRDFIGDRGENSDSDPGILALAADEFARLSARVAISSATGGENSDGDPGGCAAFFWPKSRRVTS
jgi:hypothetical protein